MSTLQDKKWLQDCNFISSYEATDNEFVALLARLIFHYITANETTWIARDKNILFPPSEKPVVLFVCCRWWRKNRMYSMIYFYYNA